MINKFLVRGVLHCLYGIVLFRATTKWWSKASRNLVLARWYLSRSEGAWRGSLQRTGKLLLARMLEKNNEILGIIDEREAERIKEHDRAYDHIPGLFESALRESNLPLFVTYPGKLRCEEEEPR